VAYLYIKRALILFYLLTYLHTYLLTQTLMYRMPYNADRVVEQCALMLWCLLLFSIKPIWLYCMHTALNVACW